MPMRMAMSLLFLLLVSTAFSFAGTIDPSVPDQKYKDYGAKFESVVEISGTCMCDERPEPHLFIASAVVIKPNWVLTAAHVVKRAKDVKIRVAERKYEISRIIVNENFDENDVGLHDIALGYCEESINISFYPKMYDKNDEVGKVVCMGGWGVTGNFSTDHRKSDGIRRAGSNIVDRTERNCLICSASGGKKTELEFMIASGDSGGGLFLDGKLAGINSFVSADDGKANSSYGDECGHTRISLYREWIEKNTGE